ncbi:MAG: hypothetical protein JEZ06_22540 [Anaerolineaceae bacterium]|nr:hypothetical protein [Anaerolineaceae bacterium]
MNDIIGISLLVSVLLLCIVALYYGSAYERSLKAMKEIKEEEYYLRLQERRSEREEADIDAIEWLSDLVLHPVSGVRRVFESLKSVELETEDGFRVVVSPMKLGEMRKVLRELRPRKKAKQFIDPILPLGLKWLRIRKFSKGLADDIYFDLDASAIGAELGVIWKGQNRLWVYMVRKGRNNGISSRSEIVH